MPLGPWRVRHTAALAALAPAVLALAGCGGESQKAALQALPPATRQVALATAPVDQLVSLRADPLPRIESELSDRLRERVIAALYAGLPCVTAAAQEATRARTRKQVSAGERYRFQPASVVSGETTLDHASDLAQALETCVQEGALERVVEEVEAQIKTAATTLVHRLDDYFSTSSGPIEKEARSEVDEEAAVIAKAAS